MENEQVLEETKTSSESDVTTPSEEESKEVEIDHKQELEKERERRIKAESMLQRIKEKSKEKSVDEPEDDDIDVRLKAMEEKLERATTVASEAGAYAVISRRANTPEEIEAIRYHYQNSIRLTGDIELDVENASAIANKKRISNQLDEAKAALKSKDLRSTVVTGAGQKTSQEPSLNLSTGDQRLINDLRKDGWTMSNDAIRKIVSGVSFLELVDQGIVKKSK